MYIHKINTDGISAAASSIALADDNINNAFSAVVTQGNMLETSWHSTAGDTALKLFDELVQGNNARSSVMQSYVSMLRLVVAPNYDNAETANTKLADLFL